MSSMNSLVSDLTFQEVHPPDNSVLRDLIVDALLTIERDEESTFSPEVIQTLCVAHTQAVKDAAQTDGKTYVFLKGEQAVKRFLLAAKKAYCTEFPDEPETGADNLPKWPAALPLDTELSSNLLDYAACILGFTTAQNTKLWYDYCHKFSGPCLS